MKKTILTLVAAFLLMALPAGAQVQFGVKGGLNLSKFSLSGGGFEKNFNKDNQTGFFVGPMVDFTLPIIGLGVDAALLYNQIDADVAGTYKSLEIPVNAKLSMGLGDAASIFIAAGPQFGYSLNDDDFWSALGKITKNQKAVVSGNIGGGVKLLGHLQIGVNYNMPITKSGEAEGVSIKSKSWQVSVAYLF